MRRKTIQLWIVAAAVGMGLITVYVSLSAQQPRREAQARQGEASGEVAIGATDLGGVVTSASGPEAGVWVIAETADLPTKFAKMVVTDDRGRYVVPDLPKATYNVWVRGYGLVDSSKMKGTPGQHLNLTATPAPTPAAAADYYPGVYWYSMMRIPAAGEFPGTGASGNGINQVMKNQHYWIDTLKNSCQSCHALGSKGVRTFQAEWKPSTNSLQAGVQAWTKRLEAGQARSNMATTLNRLGAQKALSLFADCNARIFKLVFEYFYQSFASFCRKLRENNAQPLIISCD